MDPLRRDFIPGKSPKQLLDLTRNVFKRLVHDQRLAAFEPVEGDGVFTGSFFNATTSDYFYCTLQFTGPKRASLYVVLILGGQTVGQYELLNFAAVDEVLGILETQVKRYMEERFERVKDTIRLRMLEVSTTIRESMEELFFFHVKTYRLGIAPWSLLMDKRGGIPTVHVFANDQDGTVPEDGSAVLLLTWEAAPVWTRSGSRAETTRFLLEIEKLLL